MCIFAKINLSIKRHESLIDTGTWHLSRRAQVLHKKMNAKMKRRIYSKIWLFLLLLMPLTVEARPGWGTDHFSLASNYDAYSLGNGRIHFKVLIYGRGNNKDGYAGYSGRFSEYSYVWSQTAGANKVPMIYYHGDDGRNHIGRVSGTPSDQAVAFVRAYDGIIVITNTYEGGNLVIDATGGPTLEQEVLLSRTQMPDQEAYLEFDWYPPARLSDATFLAGVYSNCYSGDKSVNRNYTFNLGTYTVDMDQQPQLSDPIFYPIESDGSYGRGYIAVPYVSFQEVYQYHTSWNPVDIPCSIQSDILYLPSADSVQHGFYLTMQTKSSSSTTDVTIRQWINSNKVDIPAYHRIHDMSVSGYVYYHQPTGKYYRDDRYKYISWKFLTPQEHDIMETDMFELQRAYDSTFADAQTIALLDIDWAVDDSTAVQEKVYGFVDSSYQAWHNPLYDNGTIYYRVRRVSAAPWGWEGHNYAASANSAHMPNYTLPPFRMVLNLTSYWATTNFLSTHEVHFAIALDNNSSNFEGSQANPRFSGYYWDDNAKIYIRKILVETGDTILIRIPTDSIHAAIERSYRYTGDYVTQYLSSPIEVNYADVLNTPCVHYKYEIYVDTTGVRLKVPEGNLYKFLPLSPYELPRRNVEIIPYFSDAGNLNSLSATHDEYPDQVLLTWEATERGVDDYTVETRPDSTSLWTTLGQTTNNYWIDRLADPSVSPEWQYRVTMNYTCNGRLITDFRTTTGSRSPWGRVSGRVHYEDGSACPGITVVAVRTSDGATIQTVVTDDNGVYLLDSLPYGGNVEYAITPTSQTSTFRYNNTSSGFATINLSLSRCITDNVDFDNISSVRFTGRVLYENSSIPVRDANFLLNGKLVRLASSVVKTDASGNFEFRVPQGSAFTLQVVKNGHRFLGDGFVRIDGDSLLTLNVALDGVRLWDQTKVRLAGRVAGGLNQRNLPLGFGLSTNNLGGNLCLVLELEGDNTSYMVRIPSDLTKDTLEYSVPHLVWGSGSVPDTVGWTQVHYQQKRIVIEPDTITGEFCADLFPVNYKLIQANATGYATLFTGGSTGEVINLSAAAHHKDTVFEGNSGRYTCYHSEYKLTYRSPISITCRQLLYGRELEYYGEENMKRRNIFNENIVVPLATKDTDGHWNYLFGAPVYKTGNYDFRVFAHEDYYYNNDPLSRRHDQVRIKGGNLKVYNGLHDAQNTQILSFELDSLGSVDFTIPVDYPSFVLTGEQALRVLDLSVESEGQYVESQPVRAYITGHREAGNSALTSTHGDIMLLDILRDPPGSGSSAYVEAGAEYSYSYAYDWQFKFGLDLGVSFGTYTSGVIGSYAGAPTNGMFYGQNVSISNSHSFALPITSSYYYKRKASYTLKTTERISTSNSPYFVGQDADVYIGTVNNIYSRRMDAIQPIDSVTYTLLSAQRLNGTMPTVGEGVAPDGTRYYLVIAQEIETGLYVAASFAYTHQYIKNTLIPQLEQQRDALLLMYADSATAQTIANGQLKPTYYTLVPPTDTNWARKDYYRWILPQGVDGLWTNEVDSLTRVIGNWYSLLLQNEQEKISAIHNNAHELVATHSVSSGATVSHTENYSYSNAYTVYWDYPGFNIGLGNLYTGFRSAFANSVVDQIASKYNDYKNKSTVNDNGGQRQDPYALASATPAYKTEWKITPILNFDFHRDPVESYSHNRIIGYNIVPDEYSNLDVSVYRMKEGAGEFFNRNSEGTRDYVNEGNDYNGSDNLYGSLVYYLRGGATKCPCEVADSTEFYRPKMPISAGSMVLERPRVDLDVHERSDVPVDRPAIFTMRLYNDIEATSGLVTEIPISFKLKMKDRSNPHGARIFIDGAPLTDGRNVSLTGHGAVVKTMEVYAGDGYDFEDLEIELVSPCIKTNKGKATFSVHYMPVSCPVTLTSPRDNWILNTLSAHDSIGYYLPVSISDFDVNYRGFDHIELQYKLATQSDDQWVNLCSFYSDSARFEAASGTKAMIRGGRIENIRFYGERDPMEQRYDLRAVSFCRHGSGFISRASEVKSGTKDTRCPRVFGSPEPANGILGVGDHLKLRFNEPIAGNYLDEDNNFQLLGSTNTTGITSSTSVFFDGTSSCGASTAVTRAMDGKSFSVDLMVKPAPSTSTNSQELFGLNTPTGGISFGLTPDGNSYRLYAFIDDYGVQSLPLEPMTDFTRVIMTYDDSTGRIRFYAGTQDVTDPEADTTGADGFHGEAPLLFGHGFKGNMLEARLWFKVLSQADIAETNRKRLTGFERKLAAYYPMNEGRGIVLHDKANGASLTLHGGSWSTPSGFSLLLDGSTVVQLDQNLLSRSNIQDYTLMFWFRTNEYRAGLFSAGWNGSKGTLIALDNGQLLFRNGNGSSVITQRSSLNYADGAWHHYVITVNRTFNNASIYVDGGLVNTFSIDSLSGLSGQMFLGGDEYNSVTPLIGHLDGVALFEQALPRSLVESFDNLAPMGDEMGLIAYLPFNEQRENANGIMEEVFSVNNQRIVMHNGQVVPTVQNLVLSPSLDTLTALADANVRAPIRERDLVTKLNFDWAFNNDELLINLNMADNEINKNNLFITVRNVEDLNGNRTVSPIMWQVFVNKNTLLWDSDGIFEELTYGHDNNVYSTSVRIRNTSGRRHQFSIEGLPDWLSVDTPFGSIDPQESLSLLFSINSAALAVGTYSEIIYLTDEEGLSEPLKVRVDINALCPWYGVDDVDFDRQMSLCAQVKIDGLFLSDPDDVVVAMTGDTVVGYAHVSSNSGGGSLVFLTIYGTSLSEGCQLSFRAWQATTGHAYNLSSSDPVFFHSDALVGLPPDEPLLLFSNSSAVQYFDLQRGWNWLSFHIAPEDQSSLVMSGHFDVGDQIKEANSRRFVEWDGRRWRGTLTSVDYHRVYLVYCASTHFDVQVAGQRLSSDLQRTISLRQGWNSLPFLLSSPASVTEALADYADHVSVGDLVKSRDAFAYYSSNQSWVGSLSAMRPGEGYFLKRLAPGEVSFSYHASRNNKGLHATVPSSAEADSLPHPQSTMTLIAATAEPADRVLAFVDGAIVAVAQPIDSLFFLSIPADKSGVVSFVLEQGDRLLPSTTTLASAPDAHFGTPSQPVMLLLADSSSLSAVSAYPTVFTDRVTFYFDASSGGRRSALRLYSGDIPTLQTFGAQNGTLTLTLCDALGRQLLHQEHPWASHLTLSDLSTLPAGIYFATITHGGSTTTIKLVKKD